MLEGLICESVTLVHNNLILHGIYLDVLWSCLWRIRLQFLSYWEAVYQYISNPPPPDGHILLHKFNICATSTFSLPNIYNIFVYNSLKIRITSISQT